MLQQQQRQRQVQQQQYAQMAQQVDMLMNQIGQASRACAQHDSVKAACTSRLNHLRAIKPTSPQGRAKLNMDVTAVENRFRTADTAMRNAMTNKQSLVQRREQLQRRLNSIGRQ